MTPADFPTLAAVVVTVLALTLAAITPAIHHWNEKEH